MGRQKGFKHSEESKQKMSDVKKELFKDKTKNPFYGKHHTEETKRKISEAMTGKTGNNNGNWKGGITPLYKAIYNLPQNKEWRKAVFARDGVCQWCEYKGQDKVTHHIYPVKDILINENIKSVEDIKEDSMLWDITNGITYCIDCHKLLGNKGGLLN